MDKPPVTGCVITNWTYIPGEEDEEPGFLTYELEGTHGSDPFKCKISMEVDGRDGEYEHISGVPIGATSQDETEVLRWDDLLLALSENESLEKDMRERTTAYYAK